jgi:hypothetical protein
MRDLRRSLRQIVQIALQRRRELDGLEGEPLEVLLRNVPGQVWSVDAGGEEERTVVAAL